jgi:hypothetical protein
VIGFKTFNEYTIHAYATESFTPLRAGYVRGERGIGASLTGTEDRAFDDPLFNVSHDPILHELGHAAWAAMGTMETWRFSELGRLLTEILALDSESYRMLFANVSPEGAVEKASDDYGSRHYISSRPMAQYDPVEETFGNLYRTLGIGRDFPENIRDGFLKQGADRAKVRQVYALLNRWRIYAVKRGYQGNPEWFGHSPVPRKPASMVYWILHSLKAAGIPWVKDLENETIARWGAAWAPIEAFGAVGAVAAALPLTPVLGTFVAIVGFGHLLPMAYLAYTKRGPPVTWKSVASPIVIFGIYAILALIGVHPHAIADWKWLALLVPSAGHVLFDLSQLEVPPGRTNAIVQPEMRVISFEALHSWADVLASDSSRADLIAGRNELRKALLDAGFSQANLDQWWENFSLLRPAEVQKKGALQMEALFYWALATAHNVQLGDEPSRKLQSRFYAEAWRRDTLAGEKDPSSDHLRANATGIIRLAEVFRSDREEFVREQIESFASLDPSVRRDIDGRVHDLIPIAAHEVSPSRWTAIRGALIAHVILLGAGEPSFHVREMLERLDDILKDQAQRATSRRELPVEFEDLFSDALSIFASDVELLMLIQKIPKLPPEFADRLAAQQLKLQAWHAVDWKSAHGNEVFDVLVVETLLDYCLSRLENAPLTPEVRQRLQDAAALSMAYYSRFERVQAVIARHPNFNLAQCFLEAETRDLQAIVPIVGIAQIPQNTTARVKDFLVMSRILRDPWSSENQTRLKEVAARIGILTSPSPDVYVSERGEAIRRDTILSDIRNAHTPQTFYTSVRWVLTPARQRKDKNRKLARAV